jgi:polyisoprenoid-binding protein YceI
MHATSTATDTAGHVAGRWLVDPVHSDVSFTVRHLVSKSAAGSNGSAGRS